MKATNDGPIEWLLAGDPAIRWQTLRDLVGAPERSVEQERARIAREGWGARLLEKQDRGGAWEAGKYYASRCRTAGGTAAVPGAPPIRRSTPRSALEGLRLYETSRRRKVRAVRAAQSRGREFLLDHRLFRSHRTGEVINPVFTRFAFPPRWHYDVLRALDYFRAVDAPRDERLEDAIDLLRKSRRDDGRWTLQNTYSGKTWFQLESRGAPSRWNTLRALRVLAWWERGRTGRRKVAR